MRYVTSLTKGMFRVGKFAIAAQSGEITVGDGAFRYDVPAEMAIPAEVANLSEAIRVQGGARRCVDFAANGGNGDALEINV